jgi:1-phosphofructokinase
MIVTFTANPSVDRTVEIERLVRGAVTRATTARVDGGGKGVNVTRALAANDVPSIAVLPAGGAEGAQLLALLQDADLDVRAVPVAGSIRANITIAEPDGTTTKINEPGPQLSAGEVEALGDALLQAATGSEWVVLSGSLPPGVSENLYATLTTLLQAVGVRVAVDASDQVLRNALGSGPDLVKPNRRELEQASGLNVATIEDALRAIEVVQARGARAVLASLGSRGAVLVDGSGCHHAIASIDEPRSTVGAGDALLAGFLSAGGYGPDALVEAVAWGTAAVSLPGSRMPGRGDIDRISVALNTLTFEETSYAPANHT